VPIPKWLHLGNQTGIVRYPASVLSPGSALGLLPSSALSSVQAARHCSHLHQKIETFVDLIIREGVEHIVPTLSPLAGFEVTTEGWLTFS
jgi:hypothetical protein